MIAELVRLLGPGPFIVVSALLVVLGFYLGVISSRVNNTVLEVASLKIDSKNHGISILELTKIATSLSALSKSWSDEINRLRDTVERRR